MKFSNEQQFVFDKYIEGKNIFITGPGGSGKSAIIKKIYEHAINNNKNIEVTALTGCAAVLLGCNAHTLHSWSGIGLGNGNIESLVKKIRKFKASTKWKEIEILIVDEVSMLSLSLFDKLNAIGKIIRKNVRPFGGIQIIFSGDFYQLPPVGDKDDPDTCRFCFESEEWNNVFSKNCQIQLKTIFRQSDEVYTNILNQIREGRIKKSTNDILCKYVGRELNANLVTEPTKLYPTRAKVDNINNIKMDSLDGNIKTFNLKNIYDMDISKSEQKEKEEFTSEEIEKELGFLGGNVMCDNELKLKVGAQVMSVINIKTDDGYLEICNGSLGIVEGFCPITSYPIVRFNNGIVKIMERHNWISSKIPGIGISQIPLILAWAVTIHKSQGATLDAAEIDVGSGIFERGQTYVALSRVKSLDGLYLKSFDLKSIIISKKVQIYYNELNEYFETKDIQNNTVDNNRVENNRVDNKEKKQDIPNQIKKLIQSTLSFQPVIKN